MNTNEVSIEEIKEKFQTLQNTMQSLKEQKISYESQLETLNKQYEEQLLELLKETGASTYEEAVQVCNQRSEELNQMKSELQQELNKYLDTVNNSEDVAVQPQDNTGSNFGGLFA